MVLKDRRLSVLEVTHFGNEPMPTALSALQFPGGRVRPRARALPAQAIIATAKMLKRHLLNL